MNPKTVPMTLAVAASIVIVAGDGVSGAPAAEPGSGPGDSTVRAIESVAGVPSRIAFGSCSDQNKPQPVLETVVARRPDVFVYLGDNIYGDTRDMGVLREKYAVLGAKAEFRALRSSVPVVAIWDDHDYGENDAGREYPMKAPSREIFLDFWRVPEDSPRRDHEGIYGVHRFSDGDRTLQLILLDTRTFRDPLKRNPKSLPVGSPFKNDYQPDPDPAKSLLGPVQWEWLGRVLGEPADVRIIATSIQFGHEYNGWESWTNLPRERERMIELIRGNRAGGVLFISGDVHWGEISVVEVEGGYPLHDVTASGITQDWDSVEPNRNRFGEVVRDNHFGMIAIDWKRDDPEIRLQVIDRAGAVRVEKVIALSTLAFP